MSQHLTWLDNCTIFQQRFNQYPLIQFAKGCNSNCQTCNYSRLTSDYISPRLLFHWNGTQCSDIGLCPIFCKGLPDQIEMEIRHRESPPPPPQGEKKYPWHGRRKRPPLREPGQMYSLVERRNGDLLAFRLEQDSRAASDCRDFRGVEGKQLSRVQQPS